MGMVVGLENSVVKFFDLSHFTDFVSLDIVLAATLDVDSDADSESNGRHT